MPTWMNRTRKRSRFCRSPSRRDEEAKFAEEEEPEPAKVIGALIVEQMVDSRTPDGFLQRVNVVRTHSATALTNALRIRRLVPDAGVAVSRKRHEVIPRSNAAQNIGRLAAIVGAAHFFAFTRPTSNSKARAACARRFAKVFGPRSMAKLRDVKVEQNSRSNKATLWLNNAARTSKRKIVVDYRRAESRTPKKLRTTRSELFDNKDLTEAEQSQKQADVTQLTEKSSKLAKTARDSQRRSMTS